jgi:hypothetical protein
MVGPMTMMTTIEGLGVPRPLLGAMAVLVAVLLLLTGPIPSQAQDSTGLQVGSRVRVKSVGPGQRWVTGSLLALPTDSVWVATGEAGRDSMAVALQSVARFDRSTGRRRQAGRGALIGLGTGAALGLLLGLVTYEECTGFCILDIDQGESALLGGLLGGVFGTGIGALVGASVRADRWTPVPRTWTVDTTASP